MGIKQEYERTIEDMISLKDQLNRPQAKANIARMFGSMADAGDYAWMAYSKDPKIEMQFAEGRVGVSVPDGYRADTRKLSDEMTKHIRQCAGTHPFFVTSDMVHRLMSWIEEHEITRTIPAYHMPTETGFIWFQTGLTIIDHENDPLNMDAMVWGPHPRDPGRLVTYWFMDLENPIAVKRMVDAYQRSDRYGVIGESPEEIGMFLRERTGGRFLLDTFSYMTFDSDVPFREGANKNANLMTCALFMLMAQPIAGVSGIPSGTKYIRKAAKRKGISEEVNVIYLRRSVPKDPELRALVKGRGDKRRRHHVRSHWAHYWVRTEDGDKVRVLRKRREHFRGSGETVMKDEFFRVSR